MARAGAHTSQMVQVRPGIYNPYLHSPGPVRSRRTDRAGIPKPLQTIHRGPYVAQTQTLWRLCVHIFVIPLPKNMQRTCKLPVGMLPQHCMRVSSYKPPTDLRSGPGQPVGLMCSRHYALVTSTRSTGDHRSVRLGKP